ncbi:hypothetical protein ACFCXP_37475 [Streptomyces niveus]|uniref:hypothetical protein n=1 Tax=Streptomyces niveus TaxID=193462 RepID=UPI0035D7BEBD
MSGVFCRITARDPHGKWAIGNWFYDPLPGCRSLHGAGNSWVLEWESDPYPDDLAAALTDPTIGVAGAKKRSTADNLTIALGSAALRLNRRQVLAP